MCRQHELFSQELNPVIRTKRLLFKHANGSHHLFYNAATGKTLIVPVHGNKDVSKGLFFTLLKQAGIDKADI